MGKQAAQAEHYDMNSQQQQFNNAMNPSTVQGGIGVSTTAGNTYQPSYGGFA